MSFMKRRAPPNILNGYTITPSGNVSEHPLLDDQRELARRSRNQTLAFNKLTGHKMRTSTKAPGVGSKKVARARAKSMPVPAANSVFNLGACVEESE